MPLVDVIIPVYNTKLAYVRAAVDSVLAQTLTDWRAVIVNDGSKPDYTLTLETLLAELNDPRIQYVKSENRGLPAARNLGIESSDSPFIAFLDSDDIWYPDKLQMQFDAMQAHPGIDLVHACSDLLPGDDLAMLQRVPARELDVNGLSQEAACLRMLRGNYVGVITVMVRRSSGLGIGFFDPTFRAIEDKEMWSRWLLAGRRFLHLPRTVAIYRVHATNMSKDAQRMFDGRLRLVDKIDTQVDSVPWLRERWPKLRREMLQHANREVAETFLESGRYADAMRYAMPWRSGLSGSTARMVAASVAGALGVRRSA